MHIVGWKGSPTTAEPEAQSLPAESPSQASLLAWTAALLLPNLALVWWIFRDVPCAEYLAVVYGGQLPEFLWLPAAGVCCCVLLGLAARRWSGTMSVVPRLLKGLLLTALTALLTLAILMGARLLLNVFAVALGAAIVLVAVGVGLRLIELPVVGLARERFNSPLERLVLAGAAGLGVLALAVFLIGSMGMLSPWFWWPALLALSVLGWRPLRGLIADVREASRDLPQRVHPVALAAIAFLAVWCLVHLALLWSPPMEYDALEYHLGAPAEYLRAGRISFLNENVYAAMPANGEMLYLLALLLGGKWNGLPAAHVVLIAAWLLSIAGVYTLTARILQPTSNQQLRNSGTDYELAPPGSEKFVVCPRISPAPAIGALLYALVPLGSQLSADFYIEHIQALFHLGTLMAACAFWSERRAGVRDRFGWLVLAGALAGLACGTKYSALLLTLAPLLALVPLLCLVGGSVYEALRAAICCAAPALAMLAPWLLRNVTASGDPLYPLGLILKRRAAEPGAVPDRLDHLDVALRAGGRSLADVKQALFQLWPGLQRHTAGGEDPGALSTAFFWLRDCECGPHLLCFALPGFLSGWRGAQSRRGEHFLVAGFVVLDVVLWFFVTHRLNRFFYPLLAPLAVLAALGIAHIWELAKAAEAAPAAGSTGKRRSWSGALREAVAAMLIAIAVLLAPLPLLYVWLYNHPGYMAGAQEPREAAQQQFEALGSGRLFAAWEAVNALPEGSRVLLLGDAQTFYLDRTPSCAVVFNQPLLEEVLAHAADPADAAQMLRSGHGITHIYINYPEWLRLDTSYALTRAAGEPWRFARLDSARREVLTQHLCDNRMAEYGKAWPDGVYPAYLKLSPRGYATLEGLLLGFTTVENAWLSPNGLPSCELRRLDAQP